MSNLATSAPPSRAKAPDLTVFEAAEALVKLGGVSEQAHRLRILLRALARSDEELFGRRAKYEDCVRRVAGGLIGAGVTQAREQPVSLEPFGPMGGM